MTDVDLKNKRVPTYTRKPTDKERHVQIRTKAYHINIHTKKDIDIKMHRLTEAVVDIQRKTCTYMYIGLPYKHTYKERHRHKEA